MREGATTLLTLLRCMVFMYLLPDTLVCYWCQTDVLGVRAGWLSCKALRSETLRNSHGATMP